MVIFTNSKNNIDRKYYLNFVNDMLRIILVMTFFQRKSKLFIFTSNSMIWSDKNIFANIFVI